MAVPVAAFIGPAVAKTGFFWKVFYAIKSAIVTVGNWILGHKAAALTATSIASSVVTGSSFETKNKTVSFRRGGSTIVDGRVISVPGVNVRNKPKYNSGASYSRGNTNSRSGNYTAGAKSKNSYSGSSSRNDWNRPSYPRR